MDLCPAEIWTNIFAFACTDDGTTGRSLSVVSRYVRDASEPVKLRSISLDSLDKILAFASVLEKTPPHLRHVQYLNISVDIKMSKGGPSLLDDEGGLAWSGDTLSIDEWMDACRSRGECASEAIRRILVAIAPTIEDLCVWFHPAYERTFTFLPVCLPNLTRLIFRGDRFPIHSASLSSAICPALRDLVIAWGHFPGDLSNQIAALAPALTDLQILCGSPSGVTRILGVGSGCYDEDIADAIAEKMPSTLENIVLRPLKATAWDEEWETFRQVVANDSRFLVSRPLICT